MIYPGFTLQGSKDCLLLIHGYTGSPYEMLYVAKGVNEKLGWTVSVPRLPGHAVSSEEFIRSRARDWVQRVRDEYMDLRMKCDHVVVGGLSMGGLLATLIAAEFSVGKLILYAPAFTTAYQRYIPLIYLLSFFTRRVRKKEPPPEEEDPVKRKLREEYWVYNFYRQGVEFFKVQRMARKALRSVESKTLVVVSKADKTVPISVLGILKENLENAEYVVLEKSSHVVTVGEEREKVLKETLKFLGG